MAKAKAERGRFALAQEDGCGAARVAWRRSGFGLAGSRNHRRDGVRVAGPVCG